MLICSLYLLFGEKKTQNVFLSSVQTRVPLVRRNSTYTNPAQVYKQEIMNTLRFFHSPSPQQGVYFKLCYGKSNTWVNSLNHVLLLKMLLDSYFKYFGSLEDSSK